MLYYLKNREELAHHSEALLDETRDIAELEIYTEWCYPIKCSSQSHVSSLLPETFNEAVLLMRASRFYSYTENCKCPHERDTTFLAPSKKDLKFCCQQMKMPQKAVSIIPHSIPLKLSSLSLIVRRWNLQLREAPKYISRIVCRILEEDK